MGGPTAAPSCFTCHQLCAGPKGAPSSAAYGTSHPLQHLLPQPQAHRGGPERAQVVCSLQGLHPHPTSRPGGPRGVPWTTEETQAGHRKSWDITATQDHGCCRTRGSPQGCPHWSSSLGVFAGEGLPIHGSPGSNTGWRGEWEPEVLASQLPPSLSGPGLSQLHPQRGTQNLLPEPVNLSTRPAVRGVRGGGRVSLQELG